jgi:DNA-binding transcriptional regulator YiaG
MANLAAVLKDEIRRLARKELRGELGAMRKAGAQYRRDIAALKRQVDQQKRKVAFLEAQEKRRVGKVAVPEEVVESARFSAKGLASHRQKLGLSAADYAKLLGVSSQSVYHWEQGKSRPRKSQLAALLAVRELGVREAQRRLELL